MWTLRGNNYLFLWYPGFEKILTHTSFYMQLCLSILVHWGLTKISAKLEHLSIKKELICCILYHPKNLNVILCIPCYLS